MLKKLSESVERHFTAAAYAEAGEFETAREIMREGSPREVRKTERPQSRVQAPGARK